MKVSVYIATSIDGFIARKNGDIDWLNTPGHASADVNQDYGYARFIASIDMLVMGRHTFEKILGFGDWPYNKPVTVLSHQRMEIPEHLGHGVQSSTLSPNELLTHLNHEGFNTIYIDGGQTIQGFLRDNLVNELIITTIPILLGEGIPLFGDLHADITLDHVSTTTFENGLVQSHYQVIK